MGTLRDVRRHAERAIEIDPDYAPALSLMGGLLVDLPWYAGGDPACATALLERAIAVDGNFTNARILLAKLYLRGGRRDAARQALQAVVHAERPHFPYMWARRFRPEAERLRENLSGTP